jgi:hypothetical protein
MTGIYSCIMKRGVSCLAFVLAGETIGGSML